MTAHDFTIDFDTNPSIDDCHAAGSSWNPSGMTPLTAYPGDTIGFSVAGQVDSHSVDQVLGLEVTSCRADGADVDVTTVLGAKTSPSTAGISDCVPPLDYSGSLTVPTAAHAHTVTVQYRLWVATSEELKDGFKRSFYVVGTIELPAVTIIDFSPGDATTAPAACAEGNSAVTISASGVQTVATRSCVIWRWSGGWAGSTTTIAGLEITRSVRVEAKTGGQPTPVDVGVAIVGTTGSLSCPCTSPSAGVVFDTTSTDYPSADGASVQVVTGDLSSLASGQEVDVSYYAWFKTTKPASDGGEPTVVWWVYDPEVDVMPASQSKGSSGAMGGLYGGGAYGGGEAFGSRRRSKGLRIRG